jgi:hypothetical protein
VDFYLPHRVAAGTVVDRAHDDDDFVTEPQSYRFYGANLPVLLPKLDVSAS